MGEVWLAEHRLLNGPGREVHPPRIGPHPGLWPGSAGSAGRHWADPPQHRAGVRLRPCSGRLLLLSDGYLDGPTLKELVCQDGPLPPGRVVYLLRQLCGAGEAHAAGLVDRDLKPGNVIVATLGGQGDVAKLLDFGLVQDLSGDVDGQLTQIGTVVGTPDYMSPEQAAGSRPSTLAATCTVSGPWRFSP